MEGIGMGRDCGGVLWKLTAAIEMDERGRRKA